LVVGHEGHCIYLSLCKASDSILARVDNRWMDTVPFDTPHPNNDALIQPYLVAYFQLNSLNIEKNKEWLKKHIRDATILKDSNSNKSMLHLYCSGNKSPPREGNVLSIVKDWPYRPIQTDAQNCYLRSHNVGYRIRLGGMIYEWFRYQEYKSFVFEKKDFYAILKPSDVRPSESMKVLSKQLKAEFDEVYNGIAVKQALVAKANISTTQSRASYWRDESSQTYFRLYLNSTERDQFYQFYQSKFPKLIQSVKEINHEFVQFCFDTDVFQCQVIPSLSSL
ncbi:hypothetical protein RFI_28962, partial [Reticulomyxa filosa]